MTLIGLQGRGVVEDLEVDALQPPEGVEAAKGLLIIVMTARRMVCSIAKCRAGALSAP